MPHAQRTCSSPPQYLQPGWYWVDEVARYRRAAVLRHALADARDLGAAVALGSAGERRGASWCSLDRLA